MRVIREFDPWKSPLCTCPKKYSFNPYTGCAHGCLYCYATYIPDFYRLREKKRLFKNLEKDLKELPANALISMSNSSDPYPPVERTREITRRCLEIMKDFGIRVMVVTKSDIVRRDLKLLSEMHSAVSITITGLDEFEPNAPSTERRIEALKAVKDAGIPAILRFDPVIPTVNDSKLDIIEKAMPDHVVTSTLKLRTDSMARMSKLLPWLKEVEFERKGGYRYFPEEVRRSVLKKIWLFCDALGISVAYCREGFEFHSGSCDGSHLIRVGSN